MKTIFRTIGQGLVLSALLAVGAASVLAQDPCSEADAQTALQDKIRNSYAKDKKTAVATGKELLEKYGSCEFSAEFVAWLKPLIPKWEEFLILEKEKVELGRLFERFDAGIKADNFEEMAAAGKEILVKQPNNLNILVPLGIAGAKPTNKQPDEAIRYAQAALTALKSNDCPKKAANGQMVCGAFKYELNKQDAISELNYAIGYVTFWLKKDKKAAIPYYYAAITNAGSRKDDAYGYSSLGDYYQEEVARLGKEYAELVKTQAPVATDTPEVASAKEAKLKEAEGILKGYLDRTIDAYSRAWKATTDKIVKDKLYKTVQDLYQLRFQKTDGLDAYIASTVAKPFPNPTSAVTPVTDEPANTTTGSADTTKPVSTTATAKTPSGEVSSAAKSVPAARKTSPKKR